MNDLYEKMASQDLKFNFGGLSFGEEALRVKQAVEAEIDGLKDFDYTVEFGEITIRNVVLEEVGKVRELLQGAQILNGEYTFSEERNG